MFTQAGFSKRARPTGIYAFTVHVRGNFGGWKLAQLWRHECGDLFWHGDGFVVWGECVRFAWLPLEVSGGRVICSPHAVGRRGPASNIETREPAL